MNLSQVDEAERADLPITLCEWGAIQASDGSWDIGLDAEENAEAPWVEVIVVTPEGVRLIGEMRDSQKIVPSFRGSGTADLFAEDDQVGEPSTVELAWLCD